jgi:membrane-associated phospholipid phosphatase
MRHALALVFAMSVAGRSAPAQLAPPVVYQSGWGDVASVAVAGGLYFVPGALGLPEGPPSCAPCDPATLPGIDRWGVRPVSTPLDIASTVVLLGVGASAAVAGLHGLPAEQWKGNFAVLANTATWTATTAEWLKVLIARKRPVLYTSDAVAAASDRDNQKSMPGGHTALAFAAATSYFVMAGRQHLPHRTRNSALLYAGAVSVAILRVVAGKHFPTDQMAGAALGSFMGWLVPTIHPTQ